MADRYWVGGSGTWTSTSTTNWSSTSGGASGASVPTASDNVIIDDNSGSTKSITMSGTNLACLNFSITATGWTVTNTIEYTISVYGDYYVASGNVFTVNIGGSSLQNKLLFVSSSSIQTLTTNGCALNCLIEINGVGLQLGSSLSQTSYYGNKGVILTSGAFNTNNYYLTLIRNFNGGFGFSSTSGLTRSINFGTSIITIPDWDDINWNNLTFSGASATYVFTTIRYFYGGGQIYGSVKFNGYLYDISITGTNTFSSLNIESYNASYSCNAIILDANQVINGTLSFPKSTTGNGNYRYQFKSSVRGVARTITAASIDATTLSNIDFQDITAAGTSAPWPGSSGVNIGNAGGNSGITFRAGRTVYFNSLANGVDGFGGSGTSSTGFWALSSGGVANTSYFPLAQDSIVIDDNSAMGTPDYGGAWTGIGWNTYTRGYYVNNVTFSKTATWQINCPALYILGILSITGGMVSHYSGANQVYFYMDGNGVSTTSINLTTTPTAAAIQLLFSGTGNYTVTPSTTIANYISIAHTGGTLDVSAGLSCYSFSSSAKTSRTLAFGAAGTITTTSTGSSPASIDIGDVTNLTITGTCQFTSFNPPRTTTSAGSGALVFNAINDNNLIPEDFDTIAFDVTTNSAVLYEIVGHYKNVSLTNGASLLNENTNNAIYIHGNLYCDSTSTITYNSTSNTNFVSNSTGNTITSSGKTINGSVSFNSSAGTGSWTLLDAFNSTSTVSSDTLTLNGGTLNLNNFACTLYTFISTGTTPRSITTGVSTQVNVSAYNTTSSLTIWNTSDPTNLTISNNITFKLSGTSVSTGTRVLLGGAFTEGSAPSISGGASAGTISLGGTSPAWNDLNFTGYSGAFTLAANTKLYGSLTIPTAAGAMTGTSYTLTFSGTSGTKTIASGANTLDINALTFDGGATYQLSAALTCGSVCGVTLTSGTLNLNSYNLTCETINSSNTNVRTLAFGTTGSITCTGTSGSVIAFNTSTNLAITGTSPLITLSASTASTARAVYMAAAGESGAISLTVTGGSDVVTIRGTAGAYKNITFGSFTGSMTLANSPSIYGNLTLPATMTTTASTTTLTFAATSGTKTISTNGVTLDFPVTFNGVGGTFQLSSALTLGSTRTLTLTNGAFNSNGFYVTTSIFSSSNSNARSIDFGASQWYITGSGTSWNTATLGPLTVSLATYIATISMTSASAKTFAGGGGYFPELNQAGAGALTITGANTFVTLRNSTNGSTMTLPASSTTTVEILYLGGTSGNLSTLNSSTSGTQATLALSSSTADTESYLNIKDINFTPSGYLIANNYVNQGNNTGIIFTSNGALLSMFLGL